MESIKGFVITLIATIVFITAIEIIAPENSMKKYIKFILGLMLVALLISPIIKFLSSGEKMVSNLVSNYEKEIEGIESNTSGNKKLIKKDVVSNNFDASCKEILENKYENLDFTCNSDCEIEYTSMDLNIKKLDIYVKEKGVKKVKKVEINKENNEKEDELLSKIKAYICDKVSISKDIVSIEYE